MDMYNVLETFGKKGNREVSSSPDLWIENGVLRWPNLKRNVALFRKMRKAPESHWRSIHNFKVLASFRKFNFFWMSNV